MVPPLCITIQEIVSFESNDRLFEIGYHKWPLPNHTPQAVDTADAVIVPFHDDMDALLCVPATSFLLDNL